MTRAENMAYYDLVNAPQDEKLTALLGFRKVFTTREIQIAEDLNLVTGRCIVRSKEPGILARCLRRNNVVGIIISDSELLRMVIKEAAEQEKVLFIPAGELTCTDQRSRSRNIYRVRNLLAFAARSRLRTALVTLATEEAELLSSMQMIELARFLGADEPHAKKMVQTLGDVL